MKKFVIVGIAVLAVVAVVKVVSGVRTSSNVVPPNTASGSTPAVVSNGSDKKSGESKPQYKSSQTSASPPGSLPSRGQSNQIEKLSSTARGALTAAVLENADLNFAQLQPPARMRETISAAVIPARREVVQEVTRAIGKELAMNIWGYSSVREAQIRSGYYILTKQYRIDRLSGDHAVISLYWLSHYRTASDWANNQEHDVYGLSIMVLRRVSGNWLFVETKDPSSGQAPPLETGLSSEEMNDQFQPYLRGFHVYTASG